MKHSFRAATCLALTIGVSAILSFGRAQEDPIRAQASDDLTKGDISASDAGFMPREAAVAECLGAEAASGVSSDGAAYIPAPVNLPQDVRIEKRFAIAEGGDVGAAAESAGSFLVYSNTRSRQVTGPAGSAATFKVADDVTTTVLADCPLDKYVVRVIGDRDNTGSTPPFTVTTGLYPTCPGAHGAILVPGTQCTFADLSGTDVKELTCQVGEGVNVPLPDNFYVAVSFSRDNCGVVVGAPPELGFSADQFDFPGFPCRAFLGGYPDYRHASFWLQVYTREECAKSFVGYKNSNHSGNAYSPGAGVYLADDINLGVPECNLVAYEVTVKGFGIFRFDLRTHLSDGDPETEGVIPGTKSSYLSLSTKPQVVRVPIDPPILLPHQFYVTVKSSSRVDGPICAYQAPSLGSTEDEYCVNDGAGWLCAPYPTRCPALDVTIMCAGEPRAGACCDTINRDETDEAVCRELPEMNCPCMRWLEGETCEPDPFTPACGLSACCTPDDTCEDMTKNECEALAPEGDSILWLRDRFCDDPTLTCPFYACVQHEGDCAAPHEGAGCENPFCCAPVCDFDPWCCLQEWDELCVRWAQEFCGILPLPSRNDSCYSTDPHGGALLVSVGSSTLVFTAGATGGGPGFCCHKESPGAGGSHTVWFKFVATDTSARINTCNSPPLSGDILVEVFRALDSSTPEAACSSLDVIGCSDDVPGCGAGLYSDVCVTDLVPGETYYIMLGSKLFQDDDPEFDEQGVYRLEIESPCTSTGETPPNDLCRRAQTITDEVTPFDLTGATFECMYGRCGGQALQNDIWFDWTSPCTGVARITTCAPGLPPEEQPYTAMVIYQGWDCPPDPRTRICGWGSCAHATFPTSAGTRYKIRLGGHFGDEPSGYLTATCGAYRCPPGWVYWLNPANGVVDPRRPHPIDDPTWLQGIDRIRVFAPEGAAAGCWTFCETDENPALRPPYPPETQKNEVVGFEDNGDGTYAVLLKRPLTPGETTTITYTDEFGVTITGTFIAHPGNVNADGSANAADILAMIDILNGAAAVPPGVYSLDTDHSGGVTPADILAVIDLLNYGWLGTRLPAGSGYCP